jgi:hypothetical protein
LDGRHDCFPGVGVVSIDALDAIAQDEPQASRGSPADARFVPRESSLSLVATGRDDRFATEAVTPASRGPWAHAFRGTLDGPASVTVEGGTAVGDVLALNAHRAAHDGW